MLWALSILVLALGVAAEFLILRWSGYNIMRNWVVVMSSAVLAVGIAGACGVMFYALPVGSARLTFGVLTMISAPVVFAMSAIAMLGWRRAMWERLQRGVDLWRGVSAAEVRSWAARRGLTPRD